MSGSNSAVECQLPKLDVAGSIPVSRSIESNSCGIVPPDPESNRVHLGAPSASKCLKRIRSRLNCAMMLIRPAGGDYSEPVGNSFRGVSQQIGQVLASFCNGLIKCIQNKPHGSATGNWPDKSRKGSDISVRNNDSPGWFQSGENAASFSRYVGNWTAS
jgi:hypothetical protein